MCLSEKVSWTTLIIGTIINFICIAWLFHFNTKKIIIPIIIILGWQYALLMQIPDALAWRNPNEIYPGKLAYFLNITQPLIFIILIAIGLHTVNISIVRLIPAFLTVLIYGIFIIIDCYKRDNFDVVPNKNCRNLNYRWWSDLPTILYFASMILAILALPDKGYVILNITIFIGSILITKRIVGNQCSPGSLWCWSIAGAGLCNFLYYILFEKNK